MAIEMTRFDGSFFLMFASTAKKLVASKHVPPERSFAPKLARYLCRTTFATAAGIASCHALSALLIDAHNPCPTPVAHSNVPFATTDKRVASHRRVRKFVRLSRSCSGGS